MNSYSRQQEDEADRVGTRLALDRGFDSKEAIAFFQKLTDTYGDRDRFSNALWGRHSRNMERMSHIRTLLESGDLLDRYNTARAAGELTLGTGQLARFMSPMIRETAIQLMDEEDRYAQAKGMLESIEQYRPRDPRMLWALGRAYKLIGRTAEERAKALDYLQRAAQADERSLYPFIYRDLGLMQARLDQTAAATESLKKYVVTHVARTNEHPPDLLEVYDYLLTFGDGTWTAPRVEPNLIRVSTPTQETSPTPAPGQTPQAQPQRTLTPAPAQAAPAPAPRQPAQRPSGN